MSQQGPTATATAVRSQQRRKIPLIVDVFNGAIRGDFTREMGIAGYLTQAVLSFTPVIGTLCALRDLVADLGKHDMVGAVVNTLSLIPFLGGFPKTARIIRAIRDLGQGAELIGNVGGRLDGRDNG